MIVVENVWGNLRGLGLVIHKASIHVLILLLEFMVIYWPSSNIKVMALQLRPVSLMIGDYFTLVVVRVNEYQIGIARCCINGLRVVVNLRSVDGWVIKKPKLSMLRMVEWYWMRLLDISSNRCLWNMIEIAYEACPYACHFITASIELRASLSNSLFNSTF